LDTKKERMIELYFEGKTDGEIAEALGVRRETVNQWKHHDAEVVAEINRIIEERKQRFQTRMNKLIEKSFGVLEKSLDDGEVSVKVAMEILKLAGSAGLIKSIYEHGPINLEAVRSKITLDEMLR
jgi:uncharacterized protein YjcR